MVAPFMSLIKALEPYHPWFYEEIAQALNVDVMKAALTFKLAHDDLSRYNAVQNLLYTGVILADRKSVV